MAVMIVMDFQGWISSEQPQNLEGIWREGWILETSSTRWFKVTLLGWLSDPFKGLSDLQLGDEKVTLNHLVSISFYNV